MPARTDHPATMDTPITAEPTAAAAASVSVEPTPPEEWYDRSSLTGDYMVMIADQTPEDFERYAPESRFCDYIDGIVYMPSPATVEHQDGVGFLFHLLDGFRCERGTGVVRLGPAVLRLSAMRQLEPDVFVLPAPGEHAAETAQPQPLAVLVIEILSKSTRNHDLQTNSAVYREAGIPEIWFVDDRNRVIHAERKVGAEYVRESYSQGPLVSSAVPGFWLDVSWLWAHPLPNPRRCLETILAGPPT
jgi:Uma2 family endonuclease